MSIKTNLYISMVMRAIIYGSGVFFTSKLFSNGLAVIDVLSLRFLMAAILFVILWLIGFIKLNLTKEDYKLILLASLFEPIIDFPLEELGIKYTSTIVAAIIIAFAPVVAMIMESLLLREKTSWIQKILLFLSCFGAVYVAVKSGQNEGKSSIIGIIFIFLSLVFEELYYVTSRKLSDRCAPIDIVFFSVVLGAVAFNSVNITRHLILGNIGDYFKPLLNYDNLVGFIYLAIFSSFLAALMSNIAVAKVQVSLVAAMGGLSTVTTIVLGIVFNGEVMKPYHIIGSIIIVGSAIAVNVLKKDTQMEVRYDSI